MCKRIIEKVKIFTEGVSGVSSFPATGKSSGQRKLIIAAGLVLLN